MIIKIKRTDTQISVSSPFNVNLPKRARALSGNWNSAEHVWIYPRAAEPQVKDLYLDIYGEWDTQSTEYVNLRCTVGPDGASNLCESLTLGGRPIARAIGRDSGARTAEGVIVLAGKFDSGGSMKNWRTSVEGDTIFRLLNVPRTKAEELVKDPKWCSSIEIEPPVVLESTPSLENTPAPMVPEVATVGPFVRSLNLGGTPAEQV